MSRPAAVWLAAMVALGGCASTRPPLVYVNLDRAAVSSSIDLQIDVPSQPPAAPGATSARLEPLGPRKLDFSGNASRLAKVQEEVRIAQEETIRQLTSELRQTYLKEVDELERLRLSEIDAARRAAFDAAWVKLRARFLEYADTRGPDAIRMAVFAGFPVAATAPLRDYAWNNAAKRQIADADKLKIKLDALKQEYDADAAEIIGAAEEDVAAILSRIRVEMEEKRAAAEARARNEADQQATELVKDLESVLSGKSEVTLPPRPGVNVSTRAATALPGPPALDVDAVRPLVRRSREAVRSEAEVWASLHGYRLTSEPGSPDRTDEFIEWRKRHHPGP